MDLETAQYIFEHYRYSVSESMVIHYVHGLFLSGERDYMKINLSISDVFRKIGWIRQEETVIDLLNGGFDDFQMKVATWVLSEHPDEVYLNYCPKCNKLARTPMAKQCRFCGHDWHDK